MPEEKYVFTASRLARGNFWSPVWIEINQERVARVKPRLVGANEESIPVSKVASVNITTGLISPDIRIDSSGGGRVVCKKGGVACGNVPDIQAMESELEWLLPRGLLRG